ncbi:MAG: pyruvate dehydrogenase complex dihydrolipoamide acetyltransferase [Phycisphaerales bacterium]|nr:pyruvate dehydrogenase complex dihydrolipoamide acetyltransferase [Phycisphaerales bacterium]
MAINITMPRLSDTMEQGTVVKWHVSEGDEVNSGDVIADIETDKATMELESFDDGTVASLAIGEGEKINVGESIVILAEDGESKEDAIASVGSSSSASDSSASSASDSAGKQAGGSDANDASASSSASTAVAEPPATSNDERVFASPLARKIAQEHNIPIATIQGSGPSGRIVKKDVEQAISNGTATQQSAPAASSTQSSAPAPAPLPAPGAALESKSVPLNSMRETIAKRLVESKTTIPHYQVTMSARMDALSNLRSELNEQLSTQGVKLSVNDFIVRACAIAMHQHPFINSSWNPSGPSIDLHGHVNIGVAVSLPEEKGGGLVVATINNADQIGLRQISAETKRLASKARDKGLSPQELSGSTFTISNLGMFGVDHFTAIVNPPNAAILAVGRAIDKPFIEYDETGEPELVIGSEMSMTISSDHRIIDGAMAASYLKTVKELLESPASLLV